EDYLKCIYLEEERSGDGLVPTGQIASSLRVAPGTATAMVKTLADSGLVAYEPYAGVKLTSAGRQLATHVLRRHRLVELFLVKVMGMNWSEVHTDAEILEHAVSDRLIERMDEMLGRPSSDPHGDPIPTSGGEVSTLEYPSLRSCPIGRRVRVVRVIDQRTDFLRLLEDHGLKPGGYATVESHDELTDTVHVSPENGDGLRLGSGAASRVLVQPV
ncbi:MAG: metal-dependent transcriptional regulator, partial [Acidobacteriota bacterium]|nr:metal-dependent transcriptional regulator [Acidobacteriota bacterium]